MIAVLMGGFSAEREISLKSGEAVYKALLSNKIDCFAFDLKKNNISKLWHKDISKAFIALHGRGGEDGYIQKKLEERQIPYTGSNSLASKICINKQLTKTIWGKNNLPVLPSIIINKSSSIDCNNINIPLPWAVKPIYEGSSIGISKVQSKKELAQALNLAWQYGDAMLESWVDGDEYSVTILNKKILPSVKIISNNLFYDYDAKYFNKDTKYLCPSDLNKKQELYLQNTALKAFNLTGASNWGRVDFIMDKDNNPYLLEINTVPGMTSRSLVPMAARSIGMNFDKLVIEILNG